MVLIFSLETSVIGLVEALEREGHKVKVISNNWAGIFPVDEIIKEHNPSIIYNNMPAIKVPYGDYKYIGPSQGAARLELCKWETRWKAEKIGFKLPAVLEECKMNTKSVFKDTVYLKPKFQESTHCAWKILPGYDIHSIGLSPTPAYIEEDIKPDMSAKCRFTICNGKYQIEHISGNTYNGEDKFPDTMMEKWPEIGVWVSLPNEKFSYLCQKWLDYAVTLGGNYSGEIEAGVKGDDIYWYEQNCRRITHGRFIGSGQAWLDSLTVDPSKALEAKWLY